MTKRKRKCPVCGETIEAGAQFGITAVSVHRAKNEIELRAREPSSGKDA